MKKDTGKDEIEGGRSTARGCRRYIYIGQGDDEDDIAVTVVFKLLDYIELCVNVLTAELS